MLAIIQLTYWAESRINLILKLCFIVTIKNPDSALPRKKKPNNCWTLMFTSVHFFLRICFVFNDVSDMGQISVPRERELALNFFSIQHILVTEREMQHEQTI